MVYWRYVVLLLMLPGSWAFAAADQTLNLSISKAPVAPDGTTAGAVTDFVLSFRDADPSIPGIGFRTGATISLVLPPEFINTGLPVGGSGSSLPDCAVPVISGCSTAFVLQGWPQSPVPPLPSVAFSQYIIPANRRWRKITKTGFLLMGCKRQCNCWR